MEFDPGSRAVEPMAPPAPSALPSEPDLQVSVPITKARIIIRVMPGGLEATLLLHPTSENTLPPTREELLHALEELGIIHGIQMELLEDLCTQPEYYHIFIIARGIAPQKGRDGSVQYLISRTVDRSPSIGENDIADYKNISLFRVVQKNQPLCEITHPEKGADGMDVYGNVLEGKMGATPFDPAGENTAYNDDQTVLHSLIDGHANIHQGKINIIEVLTVDGSINNETGNIDFVGDVVVTGDVAPGFSIRCSGSIVINGSVEGAALEAGTDIDVGVGLLGNHTATIHAGGNIKCQFIQNCVVQATGNIFANSILFSKVECGGDLILQGKKAALIGGSTTAGGVIKTKTIGSPKHPATLIHMLSQNPTVDAVVAGLLQTIETADKNIQEFLDTLTNYESMRRQAPLDPAAQQHLFEVTTLYQKQITTRMQAETRLHKLRQQQAQADGPVTSIQCIGRVYPNTEIFFGSQRMKVVEPIRRCSIVLSEDGISAQPLDSAQTR